MHSHEIHQHSFNWSCAAAPTTKALENTINSHKLYSKVTSHIQEFYEQVCFWSNFTEWCNHLRYTCT